MRGDSFRGCFEYSIPLGMGEEDKAEQNGNNSLYWRANVMAPRYRNRMTLRDRSLTKARLPEPIRLLYYNERVSHLR